MTNPSINANDRMKGISKLVGYTVTDLDFAQFENVSGAFEQYPWLAQLVSGIVAGVTTKHTDVQQVVEYTTAITVGVLSDLNAVLPADLSAATQNSATPIKKASA